MKRFDFFISHGTRDADVAAQIGNYIRKNGFSCWPDLSLSFRGSVLTEFSDAIRASDIFVVNSDGAISWQYECAI